MKMRLLARALRSPLLKRRNWRFQIRPALNCLPFPYSTMMALTERNNLVTPEVSTINSGSDSIILGSWEFQKSNVKQFSQFLTFSNYSMLLARNEGAQCTKPYHFAVLFQWQLSPFLRSRLSLSSHSPDSRLLKNYRFVILGPSRGISFKVLRYVRKATENELMLNSAADPSIVAATARSIQASVIFRTHYAFYVRNIHLLK